MGSAPTTAPAQRNTIASVIEARPEGSEQKNQRKRAHEPVRA